jgi:hypothetical protein
MRRPPSVSDTNAGGRYYPSPNSPESENRTNIPPSLTIDPTAENGRTTSPRHARFRDEEPYKPDSSRIELSGQIDSPLPLERNRVERIWPEGFKAWEFLERCNGCWLSICSLSR